MKNQKNCIGKHVERDQQPRRLRRGCCARSPTQLGARLVVLFAAQPKYAAQQLYVAHRRGCCARSATQLGARLG